MNEIGMGVQPERVLAIGVFDLFHIGHLRYLQHARALGRHLTVAVAPDAIAGAAKGRLPVLPQVQRLEIIRGLGWVDSARWVPASTEQTQEAARWIQSWGIDLVVAGGGWSGSARWARLIPALAACGISVGFAPQTAGISSSQIIATIRQQVS